MREQVTLLRRAMERHHIDYYMVPTADFHNSEYVGEYFACRAWLTGFTGSAGVAVVSADWAGLWADGRYFIQAAQQLEGSGIELCKMGEPGVPTIKEFLVQNMKSGQTLGFDGRVVSAQEYQDLNCALAPLGVSISGQQDLMDEIWSDRPALSAKPAWELSASVTGRSRGERVANLRCEVEKLGADAFVLTSLDDIAWLMNIRGDDVACNPVVLSYVAVTGEELILFINESVLSEELKGSLAADGVSFRPYNDVYDWVSNVESGKKLLIDKAKANSAILLAVPDGVEVIDRTSPTQLPKAMKNDTEVANMKLAHLKDGVAVTRFMRWLKGNVGKEEMNELSVADKLEAFREAQENYLGPSFEPIVGYGPHGAIVHYSATPETSIPLEPRSLLLVDSGGQYMEGTTDITRTFALGPVSEEQKKFFTLVLKGHLNLGAAVFRKGCTGGNLDYIARKPLWDACVDYNHGTGHGVGFLLNVHEGPQSIRWQGGGKNAELQPGMITSNEPGFYLEGEFGIRHENLVVCREACTNSYGTFLKFEDLTMVPFDLDAVEPSLMTERERELLNLYHSKVREALLPLLTEEEGQWLVEVTRPI